MNLDFSLLRKSIGQCLIFETTFVLKDTSLFTDVFYAYLREVEDNFIVVERYFIDADENFENEQIKSIKRKLVKGSFTINSTIKG